SRALDKETPMTQPHLKIDRPRSSTFVRWLRAALLVSAGLGIYACTAPPDSGGDGESTPDNPAADSEDVGEAQQASLEGDSCPIGNVCPPDLLCCLTQGGFCRDIANDEQNCGVCDHACGLGQLCTNGICHCPAGKLFCPVVGCVNLNSDKQNCGSCGHVCPG